MNEIWSSVSAGLVKSLIVRISALDVAVKSDVKMLDM